MLNTKKTFILGINYNTIIYICSTLKKGTFFRCTRLIKYSEEQHTEDSGKDSVDDSDETLIY